jgi:hypothetical protein
MLSRGVCSIRATRFIGSSRERIAQPDQRAKTVRAAPTYVYSHRRRRRSLSAQARADGRVLVRSAPKARHAAAEPAPYGALHAVASLVPRQPEPTTHRRRRRLPQPGNRQPPEEERQAGLGLGPRDPHRAQAVAPAADPRDPGAVREAWHVTAAQADTLLGDRRDDPPVPLTAAHHARLTGLMTIALAMTPRPLMYGRELGPVLHHPRTAPGATRSRRVSTLLTSRLAECHRASTLRRPALGT